MTDIVERLRNRVNDAPMPTERMLDECADEITRLRSLNKELAEAATWFLEEVDYFERAQETSAEFDAAVESANAALKKAGIQ